MAGERQLNINGRLHQTDSDPATPLLLILRDDLGFPGTRHGCLTGHCGACTVLIDGRPVQSCTIPLEAVDGRPVETLEAIETDPVGAILLAAFLKEQAGQCGYCLGGILIEAKALLTRSRSVNRADIAQALDGHLCRCGAHQRILDAVERARDELAATEAGGAVV